MKKGNGNLVLLAIGAGLLYLATREPKPRYRNPRPRRQNKLRLNDDFRQKVVRGTEWLSDSWKRSSLTLKEYVRYNRAGIDTYIKERYAEHL